VDYVAAHAIISFVTGKTVAEAVKKIGVTEQT
jgi:hypothetical protein